MVAEEEGFPADDLPADETLAIPTRVEQWEGKGIQNDGQRWNVVVRVSGSGHSPCALVEYPSIPCAGEWRCYEKSTGERLVGVERITTNQDSCIDGCEFDADFEAGTIQYDCGDQGVYAHARIQRTE